MSSTLSSIISFLAGMVSIIKTILVWKQEQDAKQAGRDEIINKSNQQVLDNVSKANAATAEVAKKHQQIDDDSAFDTTFRRD